ncbi:hypothetical protein DINM_003895 [Dirofilaria immitis]|nr:hypothetical protein [Dirofilaria immitis]
MQKSDASTKASKSSPHESETQTRISSEHTTGTVLSEVTLNIEDLQNFGRRISVRKPDVQDRAGVIGKKEQEVRIHENICQTSQVEMRQSHTDRSKLREATPMFEKTDEKEHLKDERRDSTSKATARSSSKQEKVLHKDESKEDVFRMDCLRDEECQNCKDMQYISVEEAAIASCILQVSYKEAIIKFIICLNEQHRVMMVEGSNLRAALVEEGQT